MNALNLKILAALVVLLSAGLACSTTAEQPAGRMPDTPLGAQWLLTGIQGEEPVTGSVVTANFDSQGQITGSSGCNEYVANTTLTGQAMTVQPESATNLACGEELATQERAYQQALLTANSYTVDGDTLQLRAADGSVLLTFERRNSGNPRNRAWQALYYNDGFGHETELSLETPLVIAMFSDERFAGYGGCSAFNGDYFAGNGQIDLIFVTELEPTCTDMEANERQGYFIAALDQAVTYEIDGDMMEVYRQDGLLTARLGEVFAVDLTDPQWVLSGISGGGAALTGPLPGISTWVQFGENGTISGFSGCNEFSGTYQADENNLTFQPFTVGNDTCNNPPGLMQQEQSFLAFLQTATEYEIQGNWLALIGSDNRMVLLFRTPSGPIKN